MLSGKPSQRKTFAIWYSLFILSISFLLFGGSVNFVVLEYWSFDIFLKGIVSSITISLAIIIPLFLSIYSFGNRSEKSRYLIYHLLVFLLSILSLFININLFGFGKTWEIGALYNITFILIGSMVLFVAGDSLCKKSHVLLKSVKLVALVFILIALITGVSRFVEARDNNILVSKSSNILETYESRLNNCHSIFDEGKKVICLDRAHLTRLNEYSNNERDSSGEIIKIIDISSCYDIVDDLTRDSCWSIAAINGDENLCDRMTPNSDAHELCLISFAFDKMTLEACMELPFTIRQFTGRDWCILNLASNLEDIIICDNLPSDEEISQLSEYHVFSRERCRERYLLIEESNPNQILENSAPHSSS